MKDKSEFTLSNDTWIKIRLDDLEKMRGYEKYMIELGNQLQESEDENVRLLKAMGEVIAPT